MISDKSDVMWAILCIFKGYNSTGTLPSNPLNQCGSFYGRHVQTTVHVLWISPCADSQITQVIAVISYSVKFKVKATYVFQLWKS